MYLNKKSSHALLLSAAALAIGGCSSSSSSGLSFAEVAPIVDDATPSALKATTTASRLFGRHGMIAWITQALQPRNANAAVATVTQVGTSLDAMFTGTFSKASGGEDTGYIYANLRDLDKRVTELEGRFQTAPDCMDNDLKDLDVDFVNHANAKLTLKVQCRDPFTWANGDAGSPGSGMVFGYRPKSGSTTELASLMLLLKHQTSTAAGGSDSYDAGFGYAGTIEASGTDDEAVEMLFGQFNTKTGLAYSDNDQPIMARIYAKPNDNSFELAFASTTPSSGSPSTGGASSLGCGFRMISNGSLIVVKGNYKSSGSDCTSPDTVDICVDATTLADASGSQSAACTTLAAQQFHIASSSTSLDDFLAPTLTADTIVASTNILNALKPASETVVAKTSALPVQ